MHHHLSALNATCVAAALLLAACSSPPRNAEDVETRQLWLDLAAMVASPTEFGPRIGSVVGNALDAAQNAPDSASAVARLGMVLHAYDKFEGAARCYERALFLQPDQFAWLYYLGRVKTRLGDHEGALDALRQAVGLDPSYAPAGLQLADVLLSSGAIEDSRTRYEALRRDHPALVPAVYGLGRALSELGDSAAARDQLTQAVELAPEFGAAHYALGLAYRDLGQVEAAGRHMAVATRTSGRRPPADDPLMSDIHALRTDPRSREMQAFRLQLEDKVVESIQQYEQALANDPDLVQAHLNLITLYTRTGQAERAEQHYRRVVELNPNLADAHYNYATLLFQTGRSAESEAPLVRALELNAAHYDARFSLGVLYEGMGRVADAMKQYELALSERPNGVGAHVRLGRLLVQQGDVTRGLASIERGLTPESPETPVFMYELADYNARLGRMTEAERWLRQALPLARHYGLQDLAAAIEQQLAR